MATLVFGDGCKRPNGKKAEVAALHLKNTKRRQRDPGILLVERDLGLPQRVGAPSPAQVLLQDDEGVRGR